MSRSLSLALQTLVLPALLQAQGVPFGYMPHTGPARRTTFTVRIENVSTASTLRLSNGQTAPAPNAPGLWVVYDERSEERRVGKGGSWRWAREELVQH